jgi:hypothetical protein
MDLMGTTYVLAFEYNPYGHTSISKWNMGKVSGVF